MILTLYLLLENSRLVGACGARKDEKEILTTHFEGFFLFCELENGWPWKMNAKKEELGARNTT